MAWDLKIDKIISTKTKYLIRTPLRHHYFLRTREWEREVRQQWLKQEKHELTNIFNIIMPFLPLSKPFWSMLCLSSTMLGPEFAYINRWKSLCLRTIGMETLWQDDLWKECSQEKNCKGEREADVSDAEARQRYGFRSLASTWSHEEYKLQHRGFLVYRQEEGVGYYIPVSVSRLLELLQGGIVPHSVFTCDGSS